MEKLRGGRERLSGEPDLPASAGAALEALGGECPALTLPRGLALGPSLAREGQTGLWCVGGALQAGTLLLLGGPSLEEPHSGPEAEVPSPFWKEVPSCRDAVGWRRLVKQSQKEVEANVSFVWISGQLHIRVCRPIPAGTELLYWFAEPDASHASLEKSAPANESDAVVAESRELQKLLATGKTADSTDDEIEASVEQRDAFFDGNSADLFADSSNAYKELEQEAGAELRIPVQDEKLPAKQALELNIDHKKRNGNETLQYEHMEAKKQSEKSQSLWIVPIVKNDEGQADPVPHSPAEQPVNKTVTGVDVRAPSQPPPNSAVRLSARLFRRLKKKQVQRVQSCPEKIPTKCATSTAKENIKEQEKNITFKEEPRRQVCSASQLKTGKVQRHKCEECGKAFVQLCHLKKHCFVHKDHKPFLCTECGKSYSSEESFKAHLLGHRGVRPFPCPQCHKTYGTKRDLQEHQVLHTGQRPFVCPDCGKSFARRPSLRIHHKTHKAKERNSSATSGCQCVICGQQLANTGSLRNHMRLHTGEHPYACSYCPKSFRQQGNLRGHLRLHTGERPYPELRRHLISHTGEGHLCTVCGKVLRDPHTLRAHEHLHTNERPFCCNLCPKSYPLATKLRRHKKIHHGIKTPQLSVRGKGYDLSQHFHPHHLEEKRTPDRNASKPDTKSSQKLPCSEKPAVLLVHPTDMAVPMNKSEFPFANDGQYTALQQNSTRHKDTIDVAYPEEDCIVVQEQDSPKDTFIIQEMVEFCTVVEVELKT